jgi:nucleotide-binding universal stress UspA family protein
VSSIGPETPPSSEAEPPFTSVLCAVDGSRESQAASSQAISIAAGASLTFLAVPEYAGMDDDRARRVLASAVELAQHEGIEAASELGERDRVTKEVEQRSAGHDLLVIGSHGVSRREGIVWGSTTSHAVHAAPVPVLVARRSNERKEFPQRILIASDGSSDSSEAVELAAALARLHGAMTWLVHVGKWEDPQHQQAFAEQQSVLSEASGSEPVVVELKGDAHRRVPELARQEQISLTVVGSRGLTGVKALGSVSERIAHSSEGSVLLVRPKRAG